jgi:hypothetical protein
MLARQKKIAPICIGSNQACAGEKRRPLLFVGINSEKAPRRTSNNTKSSKHVPIMVH